MMSKQQSDEEFQKSSETNVYQEEVNTSWIYPRTKEKRRWRSDDVLVPLFIIFNIILYYIILFVY